MDVAENDTVALLDYRDGLMIALQRRTNLVEAVVVQRIFHDDAAGKSPRRIA
jgi:hypothetical protein